MASKWLLYDPAEEAGRGWPAEVYPYSAGAQAGFLGGLAMIVVGLLYGLFSQGGIWLPVNLIGATLVRDLQTASLETLSQLNAAALVAGLALHMALSIGIGLLYALLSPMLPGHPLLWPMLIGPLLWGLALAILPLVNPVMGTYLEPISFGLAHIIYGLVLGLWLARTPKRRVEERPLGRDAA